MLEQVNLLWHLSSILAIIQLSFCETNPKIIAVPKPRNLDTANRLSHRSENRRRQEHGSILGSARSLLRRFLQVSTERIAHGRQNFVREVGLTARAEALVE